MNLVELCRKAGYRPESYSGRGMYGRTCLGVTCDEPYGVIADLLRSCDAEELSDLADVVERTRTDNMGLSLVLYWPGVPFGEQQEEE